MRNFSTTPSHANPAIRKPSYLQIQRSENPEFFMQNLKFFQKNRKNSKIFLSPEKTRDPREKIFRTQTRSRVTHLQQERKKFRQKNFQKKNQKKFENFSKSRKKHPTQSEKIFCTQTRSRVTHLQQERKKISPEKFSKKNQKKFENFSKSRKNTPPKVRKFFAHKHVPV